MRSKERAPKLHGGYEVVKRMSVQSHERTGDDMKVEAQKEHQWLQKLVGEWTYEAEATMEPGKPPEKFKGSESVRSLGEVWVLCESRGEIPGGGGVATSLMTLGYDPQKERFVGTFIASMMTYLWVYEGSLDAAETTLTLAAEGPGAQGVTKYKDMIEVKGDDHRLLISHMLGDDGSWQEIMRSSYRRTK
jgi:hypothetical protein